MLRRPVLALALLAALAGCGAKSVYAPDEAVQAAAFVADAPPSVTLFTVINNRSGGGAHSGLMINGSQRVMFDPAGSWYHPNMPERDDVHFGMTDRMIAYYIDYHARETFRVVQQTVPVSPEVAQLVMNNALAYGAVPQAQCANSISNVLSGVPGFESVSGSWFPKRLMNEFATLPGVVEKVTTDADADDNHGVLLQQQAVTTE
jgi:predicted small lipoprotein YifL